MVPGDLYSPPLGDDPGDHRIPAVPGASEGHTRDAITNWRLAVHLWQWILLAFVLVVPFALMVDFWGDQRLDFRGRPGPREFRPSPPPAPSPDDHH